MNGLDVVLILIVSFFVIYSLFRGFVREVFSLLSIILGFMAAIRLYQVPAGVLRTWIDNPVIVQMLGFALTFIAVSILISLTGRLVKKFVTFARLQSGDRLLGAGFGLLKGAFVATVLVLVLILFLPPAHPVLTQSKLSPYCITLGELAMSMIPDELKERVRKKKESFSLYWRMLPNDQVRPGTDEGRQGDELRNSRIEKEELERRTMGWTHSCPTRARSLRQG